MFPTIDDRKVYDVQLASEDIKAIQRLYGPRTKRRVSAATSSPERNSILKQQYLQNKNKTLEGVIFYLKVSFPFTQLHFSILAQVENIFVRGEK